jgi:hypothetical protein
MSTAYRGHLYGIWNATSVTPPLTGWTTSDPQNGDAIYIGLCQDLNTQNITPQDASAWTLMGDGTLSAHDTETIKWFKLNNVYNSALPPNTQFNCNGPNAGSYVIVAGSGIDPTKAASIASVTTNTGNNTAPFSAGLTGGTSNNGDFGMIFFSLDALSSTDTWSTAFPVEYTKRGVDQQNGFSHIVLATIDNVTGGSVSPTLNITQTAGTGQTDWAGFVLYVRAIGPTITSQPSSTTKFIGDTATFSVSATGTGTLHYQWKKDGVNVGTDSSSYTTPILDFSYNNSVYTVVVTDDNGSTTSSNALLTVIYTSLIAWFRA